MRFLLRHLAPLAASAILLWGACLPVRAETLPSPEPRPGSKAEWEARQFFREGRALHRSGRLERAVDLYRRGLQADTGRLEILPYLALALDALGHSQEALEQYDAYLALEPEDLRVRLNQVAAWIHLGAELEALQALREIELSASGLPEFHNLRGVVFLRQEQPARAADDFQVALAMRPGWNAAMVNLASAWREMGRSEEALALLNQAVRESPGTPQAWNNLGVLLARGGDVPAAHKAFSQATETGDLNLAHFNSTLLASRFDGETDLLVQAAELVDRDPDMQESRLLYGALLYRAGRLPEARQELEALLERMPENRLGQEFLGLVLLGAGEEGQALPLLEAVAVAQPDSAWAQHNLALALRLTGDLSGALEAAQAANGLDPTSPEIWYNLGLLLDLSTRPREAVAAFEKWLEMSPDHAEAAQVREHVEDLRQHLRGALNPGP
jgi:tetratricopeptide (TPR) repeat protein